MAMIEEDYVSFETAKLLKEKGMDAFCFNHYVQNNNNDRTSEAVTVCTLQMAMKWLRKKHSIVVEPFIREDTKYVWYIHRIETKFSKKYLVFCWGSKNKKYEQYEEACEAAIKYCLKKLI